MQKVFFILVFLVASVAVQAQTTGTPGQKFAWDQVGPDLATVQAYTYKHYDDASATGVAFTAVACTGTVSPFQCAVLIPAYTPGNHSIQFTATNVAGESAKSAAFAFTFVVTPGTPANLHIQ